MNYKTLKKQYKANKELLKHYKEMYCTTVKELRFEKMQVDYLLGVLNEIEELASQKLNPKLIEQIVTNAKERQTLDKLINSSLIFDI
jgi:hypothetical protein